MNPVWLPTQIVYLKQNHKNVLHVSDRDTKLIAVEDKRPQIF